MIQRIVRGFGARLAVASVLAGLLAWAPVPAPVIHERLPVQIGALSSSAQARMDVGIVTPTFSHLPLAVWPGETFVIGVSTVPGARCAGRVELRNEQPIDLDDQPARHGSCAWSVTVPTTASPGTGTIVVRISRNGQTWPLHGVVYVRPIGDSR